VAYVYDTWGNPVSITDNTTTGIGALNPFRYRGYYYDEETSLYYLNQRYYNPAQGRFVNADEQINAGILGANVFAYCANNPVNMSDVTGNWPKWLETTAKIVAVAAVVVTAIVVVSVVTAGTGGLALAAASVAFGAAYAGLVGGIANEAKGESFINGWCGGAVNGAIQSAARNAAGCRLHKLK